MQSADVRGKTRSKLQMMLMSDKMGLGRLTHACVCMHTNAHTHAHMCVHKTHIHNWKLEWTPAAFACLHTICPFLIIELFCCGPVPVPTEAVNHMTPVGTWSISTAQWEASRSGLVTSFSQSSAGNAPYSLSVTEGLFASRRLCLLLDVMT